MFEQSTKNSGTSVELV